MEEEAAELIYNRATLSCFKRRRSMERYDDCVKQYTNKKGLIDADETMVGSINTFVNHWINGIDTYAWSVLNRNV